MERRVQDWLEWNAGPSGPQAGSLQRRGFRDVKRQSFDLSAACRAFSDTPAGCRRSTQRRRSSPSLVVVSLLRRYDGEEIGGDALDVGIQQLAYPFLFA